MSASLRNDRCRRNGCRRCTTRILDDAVLEKKLKGNRKTRKRYHGTLYREEKKESKKNEEFTIYNSIDARPSSFFFTFFFFVLFYFFLQNQLHRSNNQRAKKKKRRGGDGTVGKRTRCERAARFFFVATEIYININIFKYTKIYIYIYV